MYQIIVDGEVVETVMYDDSYSVRRHIRDNYEYWGIRAGYKKIGD